MTIPLIDISDFASDDDGARARVVDQWRTALDTLGFVTIAGHGIPASIIEDTYGAANRFFDQPLERKLDWRPKTPHHGPAGYVRLKSEAVGRTRGVQTPPDFSESLNFPPPDGQDGEGIAWPDTPAGLSAQVAAYIRHAQDLSLRLMRLSALALDLPETYFEPFYAPMSCLLRLAYYPDQEVEPEPGQLRNGAHTDYGGFTILRQDDAPGGLQVLNPQGAWVDVPARPGTLVINTGDLIQRWTNDRWVSNVHRVINPPRDHRGSTRRLSIVFFTGPNQHAQIACLPTCQTPERPARHAPILVADHIKLRLSQALQLAGTD